jgi:hypothetical protein
MVRAGFIVGLPFETKESIETWAEMIQAPDFPIHSYQFFPMTIDRDQSKFYQSEFDKNSEKYGYKFFPIRNETQEFSNDWMMWKNEHFTYPEAEQLSNEMLISLDGYNHGRADVKIALRKYGFTWDFLQSTPWSERPREFIGRRTKELYIEYYKKLMSL